jgi:nicotinamide-nucleotide amidase
MRAAILSIGDELALGQNLDTNSAWLAAKLAELSMITIEHRTIADDRAAIAQAVAQLADRAEVVLMTGGLGPTADDLTREAVGDVLTPGQELVTDQEALERLEGLFAKRGRSMPEMNRKQAMRPSPARSLPNPHGTAPGIATEHKHCLIYCMPGPPREMQPMFLNHVAPELTRLRNPDDHVILTAAVFEFGMGESDAAERLGSMMERDRDPLIGTTASDSIVAARIRVNGPAALARRQLEETVSRVAQLWQPYVFGDESTSLAQAAGELLRQRDKKLATAESCTGGWLGKAIVDLAGASDYYLGGWITYSNALKTKFLDVPPELLDRFGAVSAPVAEAMAHGALRASGADYSLAITGIAGPDGGTAAKPIGTVFIALEERGNTEPPARTRRFLFHADRATVRDRSVKAALQMLRFALLGVPSATPLLWELPGELEQARQTQRPLPQDSRA